MIHCELAGCWFLISDSLWAGWLLTHCELAGCWFLTRCEPADCWHDSLWAGWLLISDSLSAGWLLTWNAVSCPLISDSLSARWLLISRSLWAGWLLISDSLWAGWLLISDSLWADWLTVSWLIDLTHCALADCWLDSLWAGWLLTNCESSKCSHFLLMLVLGFHFLLSCPSLFGSHLIYRWEVARAGRKSEFGSAHAHTHTHTHFLSLFHTHTRTRARTHARTHARTQTWRRWGEGQGRREKEREGGRGVGVGCWCWYAGRHRVTDRTTLVWSNKGHIYFHYFHTQFIPTYSHHVEKNRNKISTNKQHHYHEIYTYTDKSLTQCVRETDL